MKDLFNRLKKSLSDGNAIFGFCSILVGIIASLLQEFIIIDNIWAKWGIIIACIVILALCLVGLIYFIESKQKINLDSVKINMVNVSNILIDCNNLISQIEICNDKNYKATLLYKLVKNLDVSFIFYRKEKDNKGYNQLIQQYSRLVDFANNHKDDMCSEGLSILTMLNTDINSKS